MPDIKPPINTEQFAIYLQVRLVPKFSTPGPKDFVSRWQWITVPQGGSGECLYFYRNQTSPAHKSHWESGTASHSSVADSFGQVGIYRDQETWDIVHDKPLIVGVTDDDLMDMRTHLNRAPWPVLNRAARVSLRAGGFVI
jgi:hypothetical protein